MGSKGFGYLSARDTYVRRKDSPTVWVVDDDASIRSYLSDFLQSRSYNVLCFDSGEQVVRQITSVEAPSLLLLDIRMPKVGGLEVLAQLDKLGRRIPAIVLSGVDQITTVVQAMRLGASDYLVKPIDITDLEEAIDRVLEENGQALNLNGPAPELGYPSSNKRMQQIGSICRQVAQTDVPVLILGESGVGKEVLARYIHVQSGRRAPFVKVNCAALPAELLESELFGHDRGAFTGAQHEKPGKFELAGQGTIMLDEVAEMSPLLQAKLPRWRIHATGWPSHPNLRSPRAGGDQQATPHTGHKGAFSGRPLLPAQRYHHRSSASAGAARRYHGSR